MAASCGGVGAGDCYGTGQSSDEGKTSVNPDSWTVCGVGQSGTPTVTKHGTWIHESKTLREGGRRQRESSALCPHLRHNNAILIQERVEGAQGWGGKLSMIKIK